MDVEISQVTTVPKSSELSPRRVSPSRCIGELPLHNVNFDCNPGSTTSSPTLDSPSPFLSANERTGSSSSGKSPVTQPINPLDLETVRSPSTNKTCDSWMFARQEKTSCSWDKDRAGGGGGDPSEENAGSAASYGICSLFSQKSIFDNTSLALSSDPSTVPFHRVLNRSLSCGDSARVCD